MADSTAHAWLYNDGGTREGCQTRAPHVSWIAPRVGRTGSESVVAGLLSMMAGLTALLIATPLGLSWLIALCVIPISAAGSLAMPSVTSVVLEGVPAHQAGRGRTDPARGSQQPSHPATHRGRGVRTAGQLGVQPCRAL